MVEAAGKSGRKRQAFTAIVLPLFLVDLLELALNCAGPAKHSPVHLVEASVGCIENESARHTHSHAYRASIEFNCETLIGHYSSPGAQRHRRGAIGPRRCSPIE